MILGFEGTTLVNYPKQVASIIFLSDCNFHCPYCYNKTLVYPDRKQQPIAKSYVIEELIDRKNFITGVCISGGEPTLYHFDLIKLIEDIKTACPELLIKLDTNGSRPEVLKSLFERNLVDYVAMDFKTAPCEYKGSISKYDVSEAITESIKMIRTNLDSQHYEFRITVTRELFNNNIAKKMARFLSPEDTVYIQNFKFFGEENHINIKALGNIDIAGFAKSEIEIIAAPILNKCKVYLRNF